MRYIILFYTIVIIVLAVKYFRLKKQKAAQNTTTTAKVKVTREPKQPKPKPNATQPQVEGVAAAIGEAMHSKEGSAIRAFTPDFLNRVYSISDDWKAVVRRGNEVQYFVNPSLNLLGKFNTAGWTVACELDEMDMASAIVLLTTRSAYESTDYPVFPTLTIDLGTAKDELLLVYRLQQVIDRRDSPKLFRARGILEEIMREQLKADVQDYRALPVAGFFLNGCKDAVRLLRYGSAHDFDSLVHAFNARQKIDAVMNTPKPQTEPVTVDADGVISRTKEESTFDDIFVSLTSIAPLSAYKLPILAQVFGLKLMDAGFDEQVRLALAPEFIARVQTLEPEWYKNESTPEQTILDIFRDPTVNVKAAPSQNPVS